MLQWSSVTAATRATYLRHWSQFSNWSLQMGLALGSSDEVDRALTLYLEECYLDGSDLSLGRYVVAAVTFVRPDLRSPAMQKLPGTKQSLQGWRNLCPPQSRLPVPWEVACLVSAWAFKQKLWQMGVGLLLMFAMYLRPAELCRLKVRDVVFPNARLRRRHQKTVVTLHSFEDGIPSKTHEFDETIELDLDHHQFLTPMLQNMILKLHLQKDSSLFNLEASQIRDFLQEVQMKLHINNIGPLHPYRWRHGGASMDFWEKHRDLVSIQKRGRWRAMASVRRYEKGGRLAQLLSKLPDTTQELATWASENIDEGYYNPRLLRRIP